MDQRWCYSTTNSEGPTNSLKPDFSHASFLQGGDKLLLAKRILIKMSVLLLENPCESDSEVKASRRADYPDPHRSHNSYKNQTRRRLNAKMTFSLGLLTPQIAAALRK